MAPFIFSSKRISFSRRTLRAPAAGQGSVPVQLSGGVPRAAQEAEPAGLHGAHAGVLRLPPEGSGAAGVDGAWDSVQMGFNGIRLFTKLVLNF